MADIYDKLAGPESLSQDINKPKKTSPDRQEGAITMPLPELELSMDDEELIGLKEKWEKIWLAEQSKLDKRQKKNEEMWLGRDWNATNLQARLKNQPFIDNVIFEAVETWLPMATKQNPEPNVSTDGTPEGQALAYSVKMMLSNLADRKKLKLVLKNTSRNWLLYFIGVVKVGWSTHENDMVLKVVRPQALILDPDSSIEQGEYTGEYIGEYRMDTAGNLKERFPSKKTEIDLVSKGEDGTKVKFIEWWTDKFVFWTMNKTVLGKSKNPHWNGDQNKETVDEFGSVSQSLVPGKNHFVHPKKPYCFLSVFNLGVKPYDETTLVEQNLSSQERINKRLIQIDKNVDGMNGSIALSENYFSKEQAAQAMDAHRRGSGFVVPAVEIEKAYKFNSTPPLPADVYNDLADARKELKSNFGISGFLASGLASERTVRGKAQMQGLSNDRISLFAEYLEQLSDQIFNWFVQLMYVYYDEPHTASVLGRERMTEYVTIQNSMLDRQITVTVKEGSLIPKDSMSKRAEALELWSAGAIDPISLYEALEMPNPREMAKTLVLFQTNPLAYAGLQPAAPPVQPGQPQPQPQPQPVNPMT